MADESVMYETSGLDKDKEVAEREKLEDRLENAINQMIAADMVTVNLSGENAVVHIQVGNHENLSEEQKTN